MAIIAEHPHVIRVESQVRCVLDLDDVMPFLARSYLVWVIDCLVLAYRSFCPQSAVAILAGHEYLPVPSVSAIGCCPQMWLASSLPSLTRWVAAPSVGASASTGAACWRRGRDIANRLLSSKQRLESNHRNQKQKRESAKALHRSSSVLFPFWVWWLWYVRQRLAPD